MTSNISMRWEQTAGLPFCKVTADNDVIGRLEALMLIDAYGDVRVDAVGYIQQSLSLARVTAVSRVNRIMRENVNAVPYYSVKHGRDKNRIDFRASTPFLTLQETLWGFKSSKAECEAGGALSVMRDAVKHSDEYQNKKFWVPERFLSPYKGLGALQRYKETVGEEYTLSHGAEEQQPKKEEVDEIVIPDNLFIAEEEVDEETAATISKLEKIEHLIGVLKGLAKEVHVEINISIKG